MLRFITFTFALFFLFAGSIQAGNLLQERLDKEKKSYENGFVLIPHYSNYVLPVSYMHRADAALNPGENYPLQHTETKFQLSIKVLAFNRPLVNDTGYLFFAYTNTAVWQAFNRSKSSPFRDTNHMPEMFMLFETPWQWGDFSMPTLTPGIVHQSNGQGNVRSRSWNRIYLESTFAYKDWYASFKPWYRLPERKKRYPTDAKGDDNRDILDYYGYFEVNLFHQFGRHDMRIMLRNNLKHTNRGAVELNYSTPINKHIKAYVQLFHGYGEMLLDYNQRNTRIGFGFMFNNWL